MVRRNVFGSDDESEDEALPVKQRKLFVPGKEEETQTVEKSASQDNDDYMGIQVNEPEQKEKPLDQPVIQEKYRDIQRQTTRLGLKRSLFGAVEDDDEPRAAKPKGLAMMEKMGFKVGQGLGRDGAESVTEPIGIPLSTLDNGKMGLRVKAELEGPDRPVADAKEFQTRMADEKETKRLDYILQRMQKTFVNLENAGYGSFEELMETPPGMIPCWIRTHVAHLQQKMRGKQEEEDENAYNPEMDEEVLKYREIPVHERVKDANRQLRELNYCFYCGSRYSSAEEMLELCPGENDKDH